MRNTATLSCSCREVRGLVTDVAPNEVNRVVCYCDDCQAFLHRLDRADLLDDQGGTDIVQLAPASLSFVQGKERIVGLRLTPRGIYRWYASCCRMPLGNTLGPAIPFIGILAQAFESKTRSPISYSVARLGAFSASMRSVTHRRDRRGSIPGSSRERSAWSLDGACAGRLGRTPSSTARGMQPTSH